MKTISLIGSTGSIGKQVCSVVRRHPDKFKIKSIVANTSADLFLEQVREFMPEYAALVDEETGAAKNPDKKLQSVDLDKVILVKGLKYNAKGKEWTDTKIYDPGSGKIYSVDIEFKDAKTLKVYGNILGIGKTVYWTRLEE